MADTITIQTSSSTDVVKIIERGPQGPQGPAGSGGGGDVESVNGQTGVVVLAAADVGAAASNDARLTDARTPTAHASSHATAGSDPIAPADIGAASSTHASTHHTGGSDALTPASISAAQAVTVIELTPSPGSTTITTSQLPARGIAFIEGGGSFTVNLPTPDKRQSGLTFSIKVEHEGASGDVFITVVHAAVNLLTSYELAEDEGSIDFVWDGYAWRYDAAYLLRSFPGRVLQLPAGSGTIVVSDTSAGSGSDVVNNIVSLTQAEYNAVTTPDAATLYLITDP
jgi:hypothetical protein